MPCGSPPSGYCRQLADLPDVEVMGPAAPAELWVPVARGKRGRAIAALRDAADAHVLFLRALPADAHILAFRAVPKKRARAPRGEREKLAAAIA
ncbi:hypothetical protein FOHLNKBM_6165 [Methylobacterium longum]|nr:hypothetical protein FOHLNKBM_6165 [Methylobacterium longum]